MQSRWFAFALFGFACQGSIDNPPPQIATSFQFLRAPGGGLKSGGRLYPNPAGYDSVELLIQRDAQVVVTCRRGDNVLRGADCLGVPFRSQMTFADGLISCVAAWETKGARLYEGCGLRSDVAYKLGCIAAKDADGHDCAVCVGADGRVHSNSCAYAKAHEPHTECEVEHDGKHMCVDCDDVMGDVRHSHDPMCMDDNPNCPPENPDAGTHDGGEGGGPMADAGMPDGGEGGGPPADAGTPDSGEGGGALPLSTACAPELPSQDIYCHEINFTYQKLSLAYGYSCEFKGTYLPPALDVQTREAIDVWLAAHGGAVNPAAPPCEAMLAMATSWDCEEEHDDMAPGGKACAKRVGRQRLAGYARAQMIRDGACRP